MKKQITYRVPYLDLLRITACMLVLLTHSAMPTNDLSQGKYYAFFSTLGVPSSELFLTISGAILLPINKSFSEFYKKRFTKLLIPVFFWSSIYLLYYYIVGYNDLKETIINFILLPFKPVHGTFWFIYVICGLYLFAPFISKWLEQSSQKQIFLFLIIWGITLTLPLINYITPNFYDLNGSYYEMFNSFGGFMGYMILGYYLRKYPITINNKKTTLIINCIITTILFTIVYYFKINECDTSILLDNLSLFSAIAVTNIIIFINQISKNTYFINNKIYFEILSKYTFGIYLIHILVIREFLWNIFEHYRLVAYIEIPLISILGFIISLIIIKCISKISFSRYIVGF